MAIKYLTHMVKIEGKGDLLIRPARLMDARRIQVLYTEVYGSSYSISIITNPDKMKKAIESDEYYWLVADYNGKIVGSLVYSLDYKQRISKAFGAVVSDEFRKHNIAYTMMKLILDDITQKQRLVDVVYATTRTTSQAPQRLTESLGFLKLGIFPNTHKVAENETHCFTAYLTEDALKKRKKFPEIVPEIAPFYDIVLKQIKLESAKISNIKGKYSGHKIKIPIIDFEVITASQFIKRRYSRVKNKGIFLHTFMPFHEPNILLVSSNGKTEVYMTYNPKDRYSVFVGGFSDLEPEILLESVAKKMQELDMTYLEILFDAYTPRLQRAAIDARFIPSGYFPAAKISNNLRYDCVIFSRTFDILDFRNVKLSGLYKNFLKEYLKLWRENYIEVVFESERA
ncbi:MAG: GNAT family N-acetyltransferase [Elusimicrobiales bacterium]